MHSTREGESIWASRGYFPPLESDDRSSHGQRQLVGILGMALPALLWLGAGLRPATEVPRWQPLSSVSAYYHSGATAVFVGVLSALAVFLFTYRGYENARQALDILVGCIAGLAAVATALFPTAAPDHLPSPFWWTSPIGTVHYVAAAVLFASFIVFSLFLFPMKSPTPQPGKKVRNAIYRICGLAMVGCVLWTFFASPAIFWPQTVALECFGLSWLVKGRADWTARKALEEVSGRTRRARRRFTSRWQHVDSDRQSGRKAA